MVLCEQILEVVEVPVSALAVLQILREGHEEADNEDDYSQDDKGKSVFEGSPQSAYHCLVSFLGLSLVVLLIVEIREWHYDETQHRVERVQGVVNDLEHVKCVVHLILSSPFLTSAQLGDICRGDESDIDWHKKHRGQQGAHCEDTYCRDRSGAVSRCLVDVNEDGRNSEQEDDGNGVGDPNQARLDERHRVELPK